jgi:hypothetical protein
MKNVSRPEISSVFSSISTLADCVDSASPEIASEAAVFAAEEGVALQCDGDGSR